MLIELEKPLTEREIENITSELVYYRELLKELEYLKLQNEAPDNYMLKFESYKKSIFYREQLLRGFEYYDDEFMMSKYGTVLCR